MTFKQFTFEVALYFATFSLIMFILEAIHDTTTL